MNVPHTPTPEELRTLADLGYSVSRIADKFDRSQRLIRLLVKSLPDVDAKLRANGKLRTTAQQAWGSRTKED